VPFPRFGTTDFWRSAKYLVNQFHKFRRDLPRVAQTPSGQASPF